MENVGRARGKGRGTDPTPLSSGICKMGSRGDVSQRRCTRRPPQFSPAWPKTVERLLHCIQEKVQVPVPRCTVAGEQSGRTAEPLGGPGSRKG